MIGQTVSHYKILEKLGAGGMGIVYKAQDTRLDRAVALKFLPPDLTRDTEARERFIHEAKAASALQHNNICTVHDIDETREGQLFLVMDCYEGETLKSRIAKGQLTIEDAVRIVLEISQGLARAHESGIVHRDIKPTNIMLTKHDELKIVDFGLAKLAGRTMLTKTGTTMGTVAYMSPEQARSEQVDSRADVWSLGVVLYEMVAGRRPFESEYEQALVYSIINQAPEPMTRWRKEVPIELERIVSKCLEKEPSHRYQSAGELLNELKKVREETSKVSKGILGNILARSIWAKRKWTLRAIVAGAVMILIAAWFFVGRYLGAPSEPITIAVISFENLTGDSTYNNLQEAIPNLLITKLEQSSYLRVTTWERMGDLLKQVGKAGKPFIDGEMGFELARRDSARALVRGTYVKAGNVFAIDVKVFDVVTRKILKSASSRGEGAGSILMSQIDDLSTQVSKGIGVPSSAVSAEEKPIMEVTTSSMEAYNYFQRGREDNEKLLLNDAIRFLRKAVELDSTFAMAYYYLALAFNNYNDNRSAKQAFEMAVKHAGRVPRKERLLIEEMQARWIEGDREKSYKILVQLEAQYPSDKWVLARLASYYKGSRMFERAVSYYNRALALDPIWAYCLMNLGYLYLYDLNEYEKALELFKRDAAASPGDPNPFDSMGEAYLVLGKLDSANMRYTEAKLVKPSWPAEISLAYIYAMKEEYDTAFKWLQSLQSPPSDSKWAGPAHQWRSFLCGWLGVSARAREELDMALALQKRIYDSTSSGGRRTLEYSSLGSLALNVDQIAAARRCFSESNRIATAVNPKGSATFTAFLETDNATIDLRIGDIRSAESGIARARSIFIAAGVKNRGLDALIHNAEAEVLLARGRVDSAIQHWLKQPPLPPIRVSGSEWLSLTPTNILSRRDGLARAYVKKGDLDAAIKEYERITTFDPASWDRRLIHPLHRHELAKLYEKKGLKEKAISQYEKVLAIWKNADADYPGPKDAKARLAKLRGGK